MTDYPGQLCVCIQGNTLSLLRKGSVTMSAFLTVGRLWIEEEEIINFRELWTEKMGGFKIILNYHFIMQWKGLEEIISQKLA